MKIRELLGEGYQAEDSMSLRDWFGKGKHGGAGGGGWDRYNTKGERVGKCGDRKPGEGKPKCLSKAKAASLRASGGKKAIAAAVRKKKSKDKNPERQGKAKMVSNKVKREGVEEAWSEKYKRSINCSNPKGFSQRAHCAGRKKNESAILEDGSDPIVYLDMDGVLADFNGKYVELFGKEPEPYSIDDENTGKLVGTEFFSTLDKLPGADKLIRACVELFGGYSICSSPLRGDHNNSAANKEKWIREHLDPQPDKIIITGKKDSYAKGKNILVDDRPKNINAWRSRGGIGILYNAYTDSVDSLISQLRDIAAGD